MGGNKFTRRAPETMSAYYTPEGEESCCGKVFIGCQENIGKEEPHMLNFKQPGESTALVPSKHFKPLKTSEKQFGFNAN